MKVLYTVVLCSVLFTGCTGRIVIRENPIPDKKVEIQEYISDMDKQIETLEKQLEFKEHERDNIEENVTLKIKEGYYDTDSNRLRHVNQEIEWILDDISYYESRVKKAKNKLEEIE